MLLRQTSLSHVRCALTGPVVLIAVSIEISRDGADPVAGCTAVSKATQSTKHTRP